MRFQVFAHNLLIGESGLLDLDPSMGIAYGEFVPASSYKTVQSVFRLYTEAGVSAADQDQEMLKRYWRERDNLNLTARLPSGETVTTQWLHIEDFLDELGEIYLTVSLPDADTFAHYFE